jgi:predicted transcriptional regulator of viral defense system
LSDNRDVTERRRHVLERASRRGVITAADVRDLGATSRYLADLAESGALERVGRGLYRAPDSPFSMHVSLQEVAARCPRGVVCLLSALGFHGIGTQLPHAVWLAIPTHAWAPSFDTVPVEIVRMAPSLLKEGVGIHELNGIPVRFTGPARTVADCFRYRSRVGLDVAIEALRDGLRNSMFSVDEFQDAAQQTRVWRVARPYLEALV